MSSQAFQHGDLVIWEKPDAGREGEKAGFKGLAARGHLFGLVPPEAYGFTWELFDFKAIRPAEFKNLPKSGDDDVKRRLQAFGDALKRARRVIIATDSDREGERIARDILAYHNWRGPVLRAWFSALDKISLTKAFSALKEGRETERLASASAARDRADWIWGMTLSRALTKALVPPGIRFTFHVGRVKGPVMMIVYWREKARRDFKPVPYYEVLARTREGVELKHAPSSEDRILDVAKAQAIAAAAKGATGPVRVETRAKATPPPLPFSGDTLAIKMSAKGWPVEKTAKLAQVLYEKSVTTYYGTAGEHIPTSMIGDIERLVPALLGLEPFAGLGDYQTPSRHAFNDAKVEEAHHHAIIPNVNVVDELKARVAALDADELTLFTVIAGRYLECLGAPRAYDSTTVVLTVAGISANARVDFSASGITVRSPGWTAVKDLLKGVGGDEEEESEGGRLPPLTDGQVVTIASAEVLSQETKPPPALTEGALIKEMMTAHKYVTDEAKRRALKGVEGIGRPRTRPPIIKDLKGASMLKERGKYLTLSEASWLFGEVVETKVPEIGDIGETALWEDKLARIEQGTLSEAEFLDQIQALVDRIAAKIRTLDPLPETAFKGLGGPPTPAQRQAVQEIATKKGIKLPRGWKTDRDFCKAFLDDHLGGAGPSPELLRFAERVAADACVPLTPEIREDKDALKKFVDEHKGKLRPTGPQYDLARKLAAENKVALPPEAGTSRAVCQEFIDAQQKLRRPSDRMVDAARKVAAAKGIALPADATTSYAACAAFLDRHASAPSRGDGKVRSGPNSARRYKNSGTGTSGRRSEAGQAAPASRRRTRR